MRATTIALAAFASGTLAQSGPWGQCGGNYWTGATSCISGYACTYINDWYSQCLESSNPPSSTSVVVSSTTLTTSTTTSEPTIDPGSFKWFGVDESCAEFGEGNYPGVWGTHFTFPDTNAIGTLMSEGMNTFRVAFSMERLAPNGLTGNFDPAYLTNLTHVINYITSNNGWAILDPHNYGRYNDVIITNPNDFSSFWTKLASAFATDSQVIFDTNNEYHGLDQTLVFDLNQAAINAIRGVGAIQQYIFVEGNAWSGAWSWNITNTNLGGLVDPEDRLVYEMHQYLDSDSSGTSENCVSASVGVERLVGATEWLRANGKVGLLGEFAGGPNEVCKQAVKGLLDHLQENSDVWMGALWWAAGPWWGDYMYSFEPPSGTGYMYYRELLANYS